MKTYTVTIERTETFMIEVEETDGIECEDTAKQAAIEMLKNDTDDGAQWSNDRETEVVDIWSEE
jgi:hypothetical protein